MRKYQEPKMDIMELGSADIITASGDTLYLSPDTDADEKSQGGNGSGSWDGF